MIERVEDDELAGKKGAEAHGAFLLEGTRVVARGWGVVIQPGILGVSRVKKTANEIVGDISVCFEWLGSAKTQNSDIQKLVQNVNSNDHD